jgi:NADPH:quinone reductase-like Zn-dependent oxidoreductase
MKARAAVQVGDRTIDLVPPDPDRLGDDEALLAIEGSGVCGSDWKQYQGKLVPCYPVIDGHEVVGRIGPAARDRLGLSVGDRIALEGTRPCPGVPDARRALGPERAYHGRAELIASSSCAVSSLVSAGTVYAEVSRICSIWSRTSSGDRSRL